jgi:integrase/recombinase XerD
LRRAFGKEKPPFSIKVGDFGDWTEPTRALLRAAVKRKSEDAGMDASKLLTALPARWEPKRLVDIPTEEEALAYEEACQEHLPPGKRAMALLPLAMGLRARELVTLPRRSVERAAQYGELLVLRKGGKEQKLPAKGAKRLFEELLEAKACKLVNLGESCLEGKKSWQTSGEVLSTGTREAAYVQLYRLVREMGGEAGIRGLRPHLLRHCYATRMMRDGAPLEVVSWTLGHANLATTQIYLHPGLEDAAKYTRQFR